MYAIRSYYAPSRARASRTPRPRTDPPPAAPRGPGSPRGARRTKEPTGELRHGRVLVIDDEPNFCTAMQRLLVDDFDVVRITSYNVCYTKLLRTFTAQRYLQLFPDQAQGVILEAIKKTYGARGEDVVKKNYAAVDQSLENLHEVKVRNNFV